MSLQLERGVVSYWCPMLATTGLRLYDRSARKNHGTLTGMDAATDWVTSKVRNTAGRVLDFDGSNDHVADCGNTSSFAFMINPYVFTIEVWFKLNSMSVRQALAGNTAAQAERGFLLIHEFGAGGGTNALRLFTVHGTVGQNKDFRSPDGSIVSGWNHAVIIGRTTAANSTMVINGRQVATTTLLDSTLSAGASTRALSLGAARTGTGLSIPTAGQIASFAIWNRPLTISEGQSLYRLGPGWFGKRSSRVLGYSEQFAAGFKAYWARKQSQLIGGGL